MGIITAKTSSVGLAGYNPGEEKRWYGRPFWEPDGAEHYASHTFDVFDDPVAIKCAGLSCDARVIVQMVFGCNEGSVFQDLYLNCKPLCLTAKHNLVVIPVDGRYRLRLTGCPPDDILVVQHRTGISFDLARLFQ